VAHNPSGVDPTEEQWKKIADLAEAKKAICIFDTAYQVQEHPGPLSRLRLVPGRALARQYAVKRSSKARQYAVKRASKDARLAVGRASLLTILTAYRVERGRQGQGWMAWHWSGAGAWALVLLSLVLPCVAVCRRVSPCVALCRR
jgi:hypothetical protein